MTITLSNPFACATVASATGLPAWLQADSTLFKWLQLPGMTTMDYTPLLNAGLVAANGGPQNNPENASFTYGNWANPSALLYFGGTVRKAGSWFLCRGAGGASAWAGGEIRGMRLEDDTPFWRVLSTPATTGVVSPVNRLVWNNFTGSAEKTNHPYYKDGVTPNSAHEYWNTHFLDDMDRFYLIGRDNVWETDSGIWTNVDAWDWNTQTWALPGTYANVPFTSNLNSRWIVRHPLTHKVYASNESRIMEYVPATNTWSTKLNSAFTDVCRKTACIDTNRNKILTYGQHGGTANTLVIYDMGSWSVTTASFTGSESVNIHFQVNYSPGFVFDPVNDKFYYYQDDGALFSFSWVSPTLLQVDRVAMLGTVPPTGRMTFSGNVGLWGKVQYIPNLKGIFFLVDGNFLPGNTNPAFFVKTAN